MSTQLIGTLEPVLCVNGLRLRYSRLLPWRYLQAFPRRSPEYDLAREPCHLRSFQHSPFPALRWYWKPRRYLARTFLRLRVHRLLPLVLLPRLHLPGPQLLQLGLLDRPGQPRRQSTVWVLLWAGNVPNYLRLVPDCVHRLAARDPVVG